MPTRTVTKRYGLNALPKSNAQEHREKEVKAYTEFQKALEERREELKSMKRDEKWSKACEKRSLKTVKKAEKKLQRDGLTTPFDDESTDS